MTKWTKTSLSIKYTIVTEHLNTKTQVMAIKW